jgi:tetratricopeptide (TPR) repeat protein
MKKIIVSAFLTFGAIGLTGCAMEQPRFSPQPVVQQPAEAPTVSSAELFAGVAEEEPIKEELDVVLPDLDYVNGRILEYGRKLNRWKELDRRSAGADLSKKESEDLVRCFRRMRTIINSFNTLRSQLLSAEGEAITTSREQVLELQKSDVSFLESSCGTMLNQETDVPLPSTKLKADLANFETLIERNSAAGEYEQVVQVWLEIPEELLRRVSVRTRIRYGNALMYLHQEARAARVYAEVVDGMSNSKEQAMDLVSLRRVLADLYTAADNYDAARQQYQKISEDYENLGRLEEWARLQLSILDRASSGSPELAEYSALLRNFLGFIPKKDGFSVIWQAEKFLTDYPYSPVSSNVDYIKEVAETLADEWFNGFLTKVNELTSAGKFQEAQDLLETIPADIISPEQQLQLKGQLEEIQLASAISKETVQLQQTQEVQERWNDAMKLARDEKYDEAIAAVSALSDTVYATKAQVKVRELTEEAAQSARRRAAQLFMRFTESEDPAVKKQLLEESRDVLQGILQKYPSSVIRSKVIDNLDRVNQSLNELESAGVPVQPGTPAVEGNAGGTSASTSATSAVPADGVDSAFEVQGAGQMQPAGTLSPADILPAQ